MTPSPNTLYPTNDFEKYHAHIYFSEDSTEQARSLCMDAWLFCHVALGRFHTKPVGPHPLWSCQLSFDKAEFSQLIPWLDSHRDGLTILVHPLTGDALAEHSTHARWLGSPLELNLDLFKE